MTSGTTNVKGLKVNVVAWFVLKPAVTAAGLAAKLVAQGYLDLSDGFSLFNPSVAVSSTGVGILGGVSTNLDPTIGGYPSTGFIEIQKNALAGGYISIGTGAASDDGYSGYQGQDMAHDVGAWGHYGSATVDAVTGHYYVANEYIPNASKHPRGRAANWGTFITRVR